MIPRLLARLWPATPARLRARADRLREFARDHVRDGMEHSAEAKRLRSEADQLDAEAVSLERGNPLRPQGP